MKEVVVFCAAPTTKKKKKKEAQLCSKPYVKRILIIIVWGTQLLIGIRCKVFLKEE